MNIVKPPNELPVPSDGNTVPNSVFLAGSIGGNADLTKMADDWQSIMTGYFEQFDFIQYVFNPRRDDWDPSWEQTIENPQFKEQVTWELDALDRAAMVFMYYDPSTQAPITLLELGLHATERTVVVVCPDGFWRKGNVEIVCDRFGLPLYNSIADFQKAFSRAMMTRRVARSALKTQTANQGQIHEQRPLRHEARTPIHQEPR